MSFRSRWLMALGALTAAAGIIGFYLYLTRSPKVVFLTPRNGADWLRVAVPFDMLPKYGGTTVSEFRAKLIVPTGWTGGDLGIVSPAPRQGVCGRPADF